MDTNYFILYGHEVIAVKDVIERSKRYESADRKVALDVGKNKDGISMRVSTVFLGLDQNFGEGEPLLFETMVFANGDRSDIYCERYSTWEQAQAGHEAAKKEFII